jgi:hypothetical protein
VIFPGQTEVITPIAIFNKQLRYGAVVLCSESFVEIADDPSGDIGWHRVFGWGTSAGELSDGDVDRTGLNAVFGEEWLRINFGCHFS